MKGAPAPASQRDARVPCVLVLAGLDPSGGAGLLADAEAVRACAARPLCVATALTVQTTRAARRFVPVAAQLVSEAAQALLDEEDVRAVKVGMLGDAFVAEAVAALLAARPGLPVVVDPVLRASSGAELFAGTAQGARAAYLRLAQRALLTPNLSEAAALLGLAREPRDEAEMEQAARALLQAGARAALVKGGHLVGDPVDVLATEGGVERFSAPRLQSRARGTGCRLSSAVAAGLACGLPLRDALLRSRALVRGYIAGREPLPPC